MPPVEQEASAKMEVLENKRSMAKHRCLIFIKSRLVLIQPELIMSRLLIKLSHHEHS